MCVGHFGGGPWELFLNVCIFRRVACRIRRFTLPWLLSRSLRRIPRLILHLNRSYCNIVLQVNITMWIVFVLFSSYMLVFCIRTETNSVLCFSHLTSKRAPVYRQASKQVRTASSAGKKLQVNRSRLPVKNTRSIHNFFNGQTTLRSQGSVPQRFTNATNSKHPISSSEPRKANAALTRCKAWDQERLRGEELSASRDAFDDFSEIDAWEALVPARVLPTEDFGQSGGSGHR